MGLYTTPYEQFDPNDVATNNVILLKGFTIFLNNRPKGRF